MFRLAALLPVSLLLLNAALTSQAIPPWTEDDPTRGQTSSEAAALAGGDRWGLSWEDDGGSTDDAEPDPDGPFVNEWAVHVPAGDEAADAVASDLGYENLGKIGTLDGYYLLAKRNHPRRTKRGATLHKRTLLADERVHWVEQQYNKIRVKRDLIEKRDEEIAYKGASYDDEYWEQQWYLFDSRTSLRLPKLDLHVIPVWAKNFTGAGVVVTVLDDGLEHNHTDLFANYDPKASYDFNNKDADPFPRYDATNENKHGTRCAGEVAMVANNHKCGVGVAYNAKIGGIKMLDGTVTDSLEARALSHNIDHIDIYSASWGPSDDGATLEQPGRLASAALEKGIREGRGGKGVIYVWASGNGGFHSDNCDCDGYTGSIYTLSVSSASQQGKSPWYAERCASTMATTYSSGAFTDQKITSTDLHDLCTTGHTGTSASAPLAAGIFALILEVNPDLTWRDLQHLVAWTSEYSSLKDNPGWIRNGAGFWVNGRFGFGLLNAAALANAADRAVYKNVPAKGVCEAEAGPESNLPKLMRSGEQVIVVIETDGCRGGGEQEIRYLEHVVVTLDMSYRRRGDLRISLVSPAGTESELLSMRPSDQSKLGFKSWPFMSVQFWGESPAGQWSLIFRDATSNGNQGYIEKVGLALHGTRDAPDHVARSGGARVYNDDYNSIINRQAIEENAAPAGFPTPDQTAESGWTQFERLWSSNRESPTIRETEEENGDETIDQSQLAEYAAFSRKYRRH